MLADSPPINDTTSSVPNSSSDTCRHKYLLKPRQCIIQPLDSRPDTSTFYKVAAFCSDCACHLDLVVDFRGDGSNRRPCPNNDFPLHHLHYVPTKSRPRTWDGNHWVDHHYFRCTSPTCNATVAVSITPPRLKEEQVSLLTDQRKIHSRAAREIEKSPTRFGSGLDEVPEPITVLKNLRQYMADALAGKDRMIPADNRKFLTSLGQECAELLQYLGFEYTESQQEQEVCRS